MEEQEEMTGGDTVVSTRSVDGSISIGLPMIAYDAESAARFCGQWVVKAKQLETKALAINLADKKFINNRNFYALKIGMLIKNIKQLEAKLTII